MWTEVTVAKSLVFRLEIVENLKILAEARENNGLRITLQKNKKSLNLYINILGYNVFLRTWTGW